jgi:hypothetical protein
VRGRHRRLEVPGVDDLAAYGDIVQRSGAQVSDPLTACASPEVLMLGEHSDPSRLRQPCSRLGEVVADLLAARALVVARVLAGPVDAVLAQRQ